MRFKLKCANVSTAKIIHVDDDATGANNGTNWVDAYVYLQDALADANSADKPVEIRIAQGIYKPDQGGGQTPGDCEATFQLINGVTLAGGYAGFGEADPNAHDIELYETIFSGDLLDNDVDVTDPEYLLDDLSRADNSYHVLVPVHPDPNAVIVIDGLYIIGGNADNEEFHNLGGGILCAPAYLEISNCTFKNNTSTDHGGAIYISYFSELTITNCKFLNNASICGGAIATSSSDPIIKNCLFQTNYSSGSGGAIINSKGNPLLLNCQFLDNASDMGGGMYSLCYGDPILLNCTFTGNYATYYGGGMYNKSHTNGQLLEGCIFKDNLAAYYGGGLYNTHNSKSIIKNCLFDSNKSNKWGGGLHCYDCEAEVINCTLVNNTASHGGAIGCGFENEILPSAIRIKNCILWNNGEKIYNDDNSEITITYSCIQDFIIGRAGAKMGIINHEPIFAEPGYWADVNDPNIAVDPDDPNAVWMEGDYHLKSRTGRWGLNSESWVIDDVTSPCIDAGDPNTPVGDEPFPNGGRINMGAYGGTIEASLSAEPSLEDVRVDEDDDGSQVTLEQGQILVVTLESNPSTGYRWEVVENQNFILAQQGESEFIPPEQTDPPMVGVPGWEVFRFEAKSAGQENLELVYRRSWEEGVGPVKTFSIDVIVN